MTTSQALLLPALSSISIRDEMLPLASRLAPDWECLLPDWPGFGASPPLAPRALNPEMLGRFLDDLLERDIRPGALGIAAGHAAPYLVAAALRRPGRLAHLVLVAPTWRGPLPTMFGPGRLHLAGRARRAFELPVFGPMLYRATTSRRMLARMMRAHVYADPAHATQRLEAKREVTRRPGARPATAAFISGGLDPVRSRAAFLALFKPGLLPILMLRPRDAPPRSAAEMDALAAARDLETVAIPGALAAHEEHPDAVAEAIRAFCSSRLPKDAGSQF